MHTYHKNQEGIVSLIVTLIMMLVISLVVIGFTQVTNRTQREALDRQLATQAQYAAESGVNKVAAILEDESIIGTKTKKTCDNGGAIYGSTTNYDPNINTANNVKVTCVLVDTRPENIAVRANQTTSTIVPLNIVDQDGISHAATSITFKWDPVDSNSGVGNCNAIFGSGFPDDIGTCRYALLRVDLLRGNAAADADSLNAATASFYIKPTTLNTSYTLAATNPKGNVITAKCTTSCVATISLQGTWSISSYYARLSTLYLDAQNITIDAGFASPNDAYFEGAQAVIDSTGKAQDVVKRIQVRYPMGVRYDNALPPSALTSEDTVCKKITNVGSTVTVDPSCN